MIGNVYEEVFELAQLLEDAGVSEYAESLRNAVRAGFTSTEIFMRLSDMLSRKCDSTETPEHLRARCKELLNEINDSLRR